MGGFGCTNLIDCSVMVMVHLRSTSPQFFLEHSFATHIPYTASQLARPAVSPPFRPPHVPLLHEAMREVLHIYRPTPSAFEEKTASFYAVFGRGFVAVS